MGIQSPLIIFFSASLNLQRPFVRLFPGHPVEGVSCVCTCSLFIPAFSRSLLHPLSLHSGLSLLYSFLQHLSSISSLSAHCPSNSEDSVASSQLSILPAWAEKQTGVHMLPWNFNDFHNSGVFTCQTPDSTRERRRASLSALVTSSLNLSQEVSFEGLSKHLLESQVKYLFFKTRFYAFYCSLNDTLLQVFLRRRDIFFPQLHLFSLFISRPKQLN